MKRLIVLAMLGMFAVACGGSDCETCPIEGDDEVVADVVEQDADDQDFGGSGDAPPIVCGDGQCDPGETADSCAQDCSSEADCGDGECDKPGGECQSCGQDCEDNCCGDDECDDWEDCKTCPEDCGMCLDCPNGLCEDLEDCTSCPEDCGPCTECGDDKCEEGEDCHTCPDDCGECESVCPNELCEEGENCSNCPDDCGECPECGNGQCEAGETPDNCPDDCTNDNCGDGECDKAGGECKSCFEDCGTCCDDGECDDWEGCENCPQDCGACSGAGFCTITGDAGSEFSCPVKLAADGLASAKATGIQFKFSFGEEVSFSRFHDTECELVPGQCIDWDIPPQNTITPTKHTLAYQELDDGLVSVVIYHASQPDTAVSDAYYDGDSLEGESDLFEIVFELQSAIQPGEALSVETYDLKGTDAVANPLSMVMNDDGVLVMSEQ